jgi:uncharacterized protein (TIGR02646 family)
MRKIDKGNEPAALRRWKKENAGTPQVLQYDDPTFPREAVRQALVEEQYYLCAYTMKQLPRPTTDSTSAHAHAKSCHIEHFLPQSKYKDGQDIDFDNMLACWPPPNCHCDFGAPHKADHDPNQQRIMNPLRDDAQAHLRFRKNGEVEALSELGQTTIDVLALNHPQLKIERSKVIKGRLEPGGKKISAKQAADMAQRLSQATKGELSEYCIAVAQVLGHHAKESSGRAKRLKKEK